MRAARRDKFISSAQVAFHYGGYRLADAIGLSREERELLLAVAVVEQDRAFDRLEASLGITWDIATIAGMGNKNPAPSDGTPQQMLTQVKIPMLLAMAPEFFKAISDGYKSKYRAMLEAQQISGRAPVVDLGTLTPEQAREFYKRLGNSVAQAQAPVKPVEE